jgi:hypothetical protein
LAETARLVVAHSPGRGADALGGVGGERGGNLFRHVVRRSIGPDL